MFNNYKLLGLNFLKIKACAYALGAGGRRFESFCPDKFKALIISAFLFCVKNNFAFASAKKATFYIYLHSFCLTIV